MTQTDKFREALTKVQAALAAWRDGEPIVVDGTTLTLEEVKYCVVDTALESEEWAGKVARYVKEGGSRCLNCGEHDIEGDSVEIDAGAATQGVRCNVCGHYWVDEYTLTSVKDIEDSDGNPILTEKDDR